MRELIKHCPVRTSTAPLTLLADWVLVTAVLALQMSLQQLSLQQVSRSYCSFSWDSEETEVNVNEYWSAFFSIKNDTEEGYIISLIRYSLFLIAILLMRPTLCRSKQCCQVLAIKVKVMNEQRSLFPRCISAISIGENIGVKMQSWFCLIIY